MLGILEALVLRLDRTHLATAFAVLVLAHLSLSIPRFNRGDAWISVLATQLDELTPRSDGTARDLSQADNRHYENAVRFYRGTATTNQLQKPFSDRPLVPLVAAQLPVAENTAINLVNLLASITAMLLFYPLVRGLGLSHGEGILGCVLYCISFPTFYYVTIGYVEPGLLLCLTAGCLALIRGKVGWAVVSIFFGLLVRETMVFFLAPLATYLWLERGGYRSLSWLGTSLGISALALTLARHSVDLWVEGHLHIGELVSQTAIASHWHVSVRRLGQNLARPEMWALLVLTLGAPAWILLRFRKVHLLRDLESSIRVRVFMLVAGIASAMAVFVYALLTAYADGRFVWPTYPFLIPLSIFALNRATSARASRVEAA